MDLQLYLLSFKVARFGHRLLEDSESTFKAHRLYSALYLEALSLGKEEALLFLTQEGEILLSDAFFYCKGLYLPKPIGYPKIKRKCNPQDITQIRQQAKISKRISHIHHNNLDAFTKGEIGSKTTLNDLLKETEQFYQLLDTTRVQIEHDPYRVGAVFYNKEVSLAVIGSKNDLLVDLFQSLQFTGLGGKRSSGFGQFNLTIKQIDSQIIHRLTTSSTQQVMLLNSSLPVDDQLEEAVKNAHFIVEKCSGFAYSNNFKEAVRKNDLYKFKAGSTFSKTFEGRLVDTAPANFPHPVWNYAIPLFYKLEVNEYD